MILLMQVCDMTEDCADFIDGEEDVVDEEIEVEE